MYLEIAAEEDKEMAENWKAEADGTLIFVRLLIPCFIYADSSSTHRSDRFILRCRRIVDLGVGSG